MSSAHPPCNFLAVQGSYQSLSLALFKNAKIISSHDTDIFHASTQLVPAIDTMLANASLSLSDLDFIALDAGPGAFTSLRVTISTLNGMSFASGIDLVGVDGLDALALQAHETVNKSQLLVVLLNAYNNDVFYAIHSQKKALTLLEPKGYKKIDQLLLDLQKKHNGKQIVFAGNGALLHKEVIQTACGDNAVILDSPLLSSAEYIGRLGYAQWQKKEGITKKVSPLYLKEHTFKPKYKKTTK